MKILVLRMLPLVLVIGPPLEAFALKAAVTVTATTSGTINTTTIGTNSILQNNNYILCPSAPSFSLIFIPGMPASSNFCFTTVGAAGNVLPITWNVGSFPYEAGTHTYYINIEPSAGPVLNLDGHLCRGSTIQQSPGCSAAFCPNENLPNTSNGRCSAAGGFLTTTCDASGHVESVTSNLTLTCP